MRDDPTPTSTPTGDDRERRGLRRLRSVTPTSVAIVVAFATFPLATFVDANRYDLVDIGAVLPWWAATLAVAVAGFGLLLVGTRTAAPERLAVAVGVVVTGFYHFDRLWVPADAGRIELVEFALVVAALAVGVYLVTHNVTARRFAGLLAVMLALIPALSYAQWRLSSGPDAGRTAAPRVGPPSSTVPASTGTAQPVAAASPEAGTSEVAPVADAAAVVLADLPSDASSAALPNIYVFLLDERSRRDQLDRVAGLDTSAFEDELAELGFSVSPTSFAAYPKTLLSVSSLFEMDYVATSPDQIADGLLSFRSRLEGDNAFVRLLRDHGYRYAYSHPGPFDWLTCDPTMADLCIEPRTKSLRLSEVDRVLAERTPLGMLTSETAPSTDVPYILDELDAHRAALDGPTLLFGHVLSPHGPYRYEADCGLRERFVPSDALDAPERLVAYAQDVTCTDRLTLQGLRRLVREDPDAVVVLLSDHGSNFGQEGNTLADWSVEGLQERFEVLDAIRAPGCSNLPDQRGVLVNTFRYVLACVSGTEPQVVPPRAFVWWEENPLGLEEVPDPTSLFAAP